MATLCEEKSRFLVPFGEDLCTVPLQTRLSGDELFRRLLCLRFEVAYTSLPLGRKALQTFALEACRRERAAPEESGAFTADDLRMALQRANEEHNWLQLLFTPCGQYGVTVDWTQKAEQFVLFLQTSALGSPGAGAIRRTAQSGSPTDPPRSHGRRRSGSVG